MRVFIFAYGLVAYFSFLVAILYAIGFVGNLVVPKGIDAGTPGPVSQAILINVLMLAVFAIQHTIMARFAFKAWWTKIIPEAAERSTFVLITSSILLFTFWQWRPMPEVVWRVDSQLFQYVLYAVYALGWGLVFYSSFLIDHFDLFGLRQVYLCLIGKEYTNPPFAQPMLYRLVRNPLMLGFLLAFWSTPLMTRGHLLFTVVTTLYIFFGIYMEERGLLTVLGEDYRAYRARTPMVIPFLKAPQR